MKKVAVLLADGFEEIEAIATVDILRRGGITCHMVSLGGDVVNGSHNIRITTDFLLKDVVTREYDMVVLPGGLPGADNLMNSIEVISLVQDFAASSDKYVAAICAAPQVLAKASVVNGKRVTSYPSQAYKDLLKEKGADYEDDELVVYDSNLITSRGPVTTFSFAYKLVDILGGDTRLLKEGMLYNSLCSYTEKK